MHHHKNSIAVKLKIGCTCCNIFHKKLLLIKTNIKDKTWLILNGSIIQNII